MHELTQMLKADMKPALGVTEPGAIAFAVAKARSYTQGELRKVNVAMNSGMYKNAFTCGIPNSNRVGNIYAAALGYVAGNAELGLQSLAGVTPEDNEAAEELVRAGKISVELSGITSRIFIEATVETESDKAVVTIHDSHTNITCITVNGKTVMGEPDADGALASNGTASGDGAATGDGACDADCADGASSSGTAKGAAAEVVTGSIRTAMENSAAEDHLIHHYTLQQLVDYVNEVPLEEIEFIKEAYTVNLELFRAGMASSRTTFGKRLLEKNGGAEISADEQKSASLLCNATIEARVLGLDKPAMSITGSGAHGIIATMPLYAAYKINNYSEELLLRATALSYLVCTYIKEYSGRLSAFCGCAIAAGSGMACALVYMRGGTVEMMAKTLNNMASSITGMICDGGNQGCTMKGVAAVDAAYQSVDFAMHDVYIYNEHGINGKTPEETMRNMGLIASPGMTGTEKTIVEIFESKL